MKKFIILFVCILLITGCNKKIDKDLSEIMNNLYNGINEEDKPIMLEDTIITKDNIEYYLGTSDIDYKEAVARESLINTTAHSTILLRVNNKSNIESIKLKIKDNINPNKWVFTGVDKEDIVIKSKNDIIIVIMIKDDNIRNIIESNFDIL